MHLFPSGLHTQTSTIADGNMSFRFGAIDEVLRNRRRFLSENAADYAHCICMQCNHGENIVSVNRDSPGMGAESPEAMIEAEVLVTDEPGIPLMLLTADCIPGIFFDPINRVVALAHLNRKTIAHALGQKTVQYMHDVYGSRPSDLLVSFGPHIKKTSYQFPLPLTEPTPPALVPFVEEDDGVVYIDMTHAEIAALTAVGVERSQITVSDIDTGTSSHHFSHYTAQRDPDAPEGRLATIATLSPRTSSD